MAMGRRKDLIDSKPDPCFPLPATQCCWSTQAPGLRVVPQPSFPLSQSSSCDRRPPFNCAAGNPYGPLAIGASHLPFTPAALMHHARGTASAGRMPWPSLKCWAWQRALSSLCGPHDRVNSDILLVKAIAPSFSLSPPSQPLAKDLQSTRRAH